MVTTAPHLRRALQQLGQAAVVVDREQEPGQAAGNVQLHASCQVAGCSSSLKRLTRAHSLATARIFIDDTGLGVYHQDHACQH
jgi:hypothetical protein